MEIRESRMQLTLNTQQSTAPQSAGAAPGARARASREAESQQVQHVSQIESQAEGEGREKGELLGAALRRRRRKRDGVKASLERLASLTQPGRRRTQVASEREQSSSCIRAPRNAAEAEEGGAPSSKLRARHPISAPSWLTSSSKIASRTNFMLPVSVAQVM